MFRRPQSYTRQTTDTKCPGNFAPSRTPSVQGLRCDNQSAGHRAFNRKSGLPMKHSSTMGGLEIGIRFQRNVSQDTYYYAVGTPGLGVQREGASKVSASASLKQDNCGPFSERPKPASLSACMGLNVNASPPSGTAQSQVYVNRNRGLGVPGCCEYESGTPAPVKCT